MTASGCDTGQLCKLLLEVTGNETVAELGVLLVARPGSVVLIIIGAFFLNRVGVRLIRRFELRYEKEIDGRVARAAVLGTEGGTPRSATRRRQRLHAIAGAVRSGLAIMLGIAALLLSLAQFMDLGPVLAGAGLAGVVLGFGAQNLIADLLAGFSMLVEDQYGVGDWIDVEGTVGEVENVGLRTTSMRDLDGVLWHIPNGHMNKVGNLTQRWARATLEIPLPLDVDIPHARDIVQRVAGALAEDPEWEDDIIAPPEIWGITAWDATGLRMRLVIPTRPLRNFDVNRQMRERLKMAFDREGIRMPVAITEIAGAPGRDAMQVIGREDERTQPRPNRPRRDATSPSDANTTGRLPAELGRITPRKPAGLGSDRPARPD